MDVFATLSMLYAAAAPAPFMAALPLFLVCAALFVAVARKAGLGARLGGHVASFRRLPPLARGAVLAGLVAVVAYGGSKPGNATRGVSGTRGGAAPQNSEPWFSQAQIDAGFVLAGVSTNIVFDASPPPDATVNRLWRLRGASEDSFAAGLASPFPFGTNVLESVRVWSRGVISSDPHDPPPGASALPDGSGAVFLAPLHTPLGIAPEGNWRLLPDGAESLFWHGATATGASVFTWRDVLSGRSAECPVSFQAELRRDGDFVFRYDLGTNAPPAPSVIGAQSGADAGVAALLRLPGAGCSPDAHVCAEVWTTNGPMQLCEAVAGARRFELRWRRIAGIDFESGVRDHDEDGVSTFLEIMVHGTDPLDADSDGDGLSDGVEIASGGNPTNADGDGDGVPDGVAEAEWLAHPLFANATNAANLTISLLREIPEGAAATLTISDLAIPLSQPASWDLHLAPNVAYPFTVRGFNDPFIQLSAAEPEAAAPASKRAAPAATRNGNDSGAFILDDPHGYFADGNASPGSGAMGFVNSFDLDYGPKVPYDDLCVHAPYQAFHLTVSNLALQCARDRLQWSAWGGYVETNAYNDTVAFVLTEDFGGVYAYLSPPSALFGEAHTPIVYAHIHSAGAICKACGYPHDDAPGCWHTAGCAALSSMAADCTCAPLLIRVNSDDDDNNGAQDCTQNGIVPGENDLYNFSIPKRNPCVVCGCEDYATWKIKKAPSGLRLRLNGQVIGAGGEIPSGSGIMVEARTEAGPSDPHAIEFDIYGDDGDTTPLRTITRRFIAANAQVRLGAMAGPTWLVAKRAAPYSVSLQNECPDDMTPKISLYGTANHPSLDIETEGGAPVRLNPGGTAETPRNTTLDGWLDASIAGSATLSYRVECAGGSPSLTDSAQIHIVDVSLPDRAIACGAQTSYCIPFADGSTGWTLEYVSGPTPCPTHTHTGASYTTPANLPPGTYRISASVHNIAGAPSSVSAQLRVHGTRIAAGNNAGQTGSDERIQITLDSGFSPDAADWSVEPAVAGGARLYASGTGGAPTTSLTGASTVWVSPGDIARKYTITARNAYMASVRDSMYFDAISLELPFLRCLAPAEAQSSKPVQCAIANMDVSELRWSIAPHSPGGVGIATEADGAGQASLEGVNPIHVISSGSAGNFTLRAWHDAYPHIASTAEVSFVGIGVEPDHFGMKADGEGRRRIEATLRNMEAADLVWTISPEITNGARLHASTNSPGGATTLGGASDVWVSSGSAAQNYTITAHHRFSEDAYGNPSIVATSRLDVVSFELNRTRAVMKSHGPATNVFSVVASDGSLADWKIMPSPPPLGAGIASGVNGFYSGQALETGTIWVQPNSYITNYTVTATHPVHTNIMETAALVVADICLEPITTETNSAGLVYNPCSVPTGQYRDFKIKVEPQHAIPDSHIKWVGNVSFRNGQDKGRIVGLSPNQEDQIVEIEIEGLVNAKPEINVTTTSSQTVPVRFMIVCDRDGNPATSTHQCTNWINGANMILDQVGVTLSVQSIAFTNRQDWYTVQYTNSAQRKALCSALTSGNGFEVYCVNEIQMPTPPGVNQRYAVGLNSKYGTILGAIADDNTLAHEIGHQLGWKDIYPSHEDSTEPPVTGPISPTRLPDDWTGGENWYPRGMQQAEAITRLLMYGMSVPSKKDIPSGSVYGITYQYLHSNGVWVKHWHTLLVDIGRDSWNGVVPSHQ